MEKKMLCLYQLCVCLLLGVRGKGAPKKIIKKEDSFLKNNYDQIKRNQ